VLEELLCRQIARLAPVEDGLRDIRCEIAEADEPRKIGWAHALLLCQCGKRNAVAADERGVEPARPEEQLYQSRIRFRGVKRAIAGILTRWWCGSPASGCICGVPSTRGRGSRHPGPAPTRQSVGVAVMRKLKKKQGFAPNLLVTDKLRSYAAAFRHLHLTCPHQKGPRKNNRAEDSHQAVRRRDGHPLLERLTPPVSELAAEYWIIVPIAAPVAVTDPPAEHDDADPDASAAGS